MVSVVLDARGDVGGGVAAECNAGGVPVCAREVAEMIKYMSEKSMKGTGEEEKAPNAKTYVVH